MCCSIDGGYLCCVGVLMTVWLMLAVLCRITSVVEMRLLIISV